MLRMPFSDTSFARRHAVEEVAIAVRGQKVNSTRATLGHFCERAKISLEGTKMRTTNARACPHRFSCDLG